MLKLAGGICLGMNIADLLKLEGGLHGHGIVHIAAEVVGVLDIFELVGQLFHDRLGSLDNSVHKLWQAFLPPQDAQPQGRPTAYPWFGKCKGR